MLTSISVTQKLLFRKN